MNYMVCYVWTFWPSKHKLTGTGLLHILQSVQFQVENDVTLLDDLHIRTQPFSSLMDYA